MILAKQKGSSAWKRFGRSVVLGGWDNTWITGTRTNHTTSIDLGSVWQQPTVKWADVDFVWADVDFVSHVLRLMECQCYDK